jgi:hypothetical protein
MRHANATGVDELANAPISFSTLSLDNAEVSPYPFFVQVFILKDFFHTNLALRDRRRRHRRAMKSSETPQVSARTNRELRPELQKPIARYFSTDRRRKASTGFRFVFSTGPALHVF